MSFMRQAHCPLPRLRQTPIDPGLDRRAPHGWGVALQPSTDITRERLIGRVARRTEGFDLQRGYFGFECLSELACGRGATKRLQAAQCSAVLRPLGREHGGERRERAIELRHLDAANHA